MQKVDSVNVWSTGTVFRSAFVALALVLTGAAIAAPTPALAAKKEAAASPSPSPEPSPTATPEALSVQIPRLQGILAKNPNDKDALNLLAQDYFTTGRPDLTVGLTQKLIALGQKTAQVYYLEGISLRQLGKQKEALADLEQAGNLEPTNISVLSALANMYLSMNRGSDAERVAVRATKFNASDEQAWISYGEVLANEQKYDEARAQLETAAKLNPKDPEPFLIEAETYERQQAIALASSEYDRALAVDAKNQRAELGKARILAQGHDIKGAMALYTQVLQQLTTDSDRVAIMDEMAHTYAVEKMNAEADNEYRLAIQTYPKEPLAHLNYGDYLAFTKDLPGAEREWLTAAGPSNNYPDAVARLADYYGSAKNWNKAISYFTRLSQLSADDPKVWLALANAYVQNRQYDKAAAAFKQSYAVQRSAEALLGLAQSDYLSHNYKECSVIYEAVDHNQPSFTKANPNMLYVLGDCYEGSNQLDKSLATFKRFEPFTTSGSLARKQVDKKIAEVTSRMKPAAKKPAAKKTTAAANTKGSTQH